MADHPSARIDAMYQTRTVDAQQANREVALRAALGALAPHNDDDQQGYETVLQRLHAAIALELARLQVPVAPPVEQKG